MVYLQSHPTWEFSIDLLSHLWWGPQQAAVPVFIIKCGFKLCLTFLDLPKLPYCTAHDFHDSDSENQCCYDHVLWLAGLLLSISELFKVISAKNTTFSFNVLLWSHIKSHSSSLSLSLSQRVQVTLMFINIFLKTSIFFWFHLPCFKRLDLSFLSVPLIWGGFKNINS